MFQTALKPQSCSHKRSGCTLLAGPSVMHMTNAWFFYLGDDRADDKIKVRLWQRGQLQDLGCIWQGFVCVCVFVRMFSCVRVSLKSPKVSVCKCTEVILAGRQHHKAPCVLGWRPSAHRKCLFLYFHTKWCGGSYKMSFLSSPLLLFADKNSQAQILICGFITMGRILAFT